MDVLKSTSRADAYAHKDEAIGEMCEAAKTDRIDQVMHQPFRSMVIIGVITVIAIMHFNFHW